MEGGGHRDARLSAVPPTIDKINPNINKMLLAKERERTEGGVRMACGLLKFEANYYQSAFV